MDKAEHDKIMLKQLATLESNSGREQFLPTTQPLYSDTANRDRMQKLIPLRVEFRLQMQRAT